MSKLKFCAKKVLKSYNDIFGAKIQTALIWISASSRLGLNFAKIQTHKNEYFTWIFAPKLYQNVIGIFGAKIQTLILIST